MRTSQERPFESSTNSSRNSKNSISTKTATLIQKIPKNIQFIIVSGALLSSVGSCSYLLLERNSVRALPTLGMQDVKEKLDDSQLNNQLKYFETSMNTPGAIIVLINQEQPNTNQLKTVFAPLVSLENQNFNIADAQSINGGNFSTAQTRLLNDVPGNHSWYQRQIATYTPQQQGTYTFHDTHLLIVRNKGDDHTDADDWSVIDKNGRQTPYKVVGIKINGINYLHNPQIDITQTTNSSLK